MPFWKGENLSMRGKDDLALLLHIKRIEVTPSFHEAPDPLTRKLCRSVDNQTLNGRNLDSHSFCEVSDRAADAAQNVIKIARVGHAQLICQIRIENLLSCFRLPHEERKCLSRPLLIKLIAADTLHCFECCAPHKPLPAQTQLRGEHGPCSEERWARGESVLQGYKRCSTIVE